MNGAFESIRQGLDEAVEFAKGKRNGARIHSRPVPDVKTVRNKTGMDQNEFAVTLGITVNTLKCWENGERKPRGPGLVLLNIIDKDTKTVIDMLSHGKIRTPPHL